MASGAARCLQDKAEGLLLQTYTSNVFVNNKEVAVLGTKVKSHGDNPHSNAKMVESSNTVFSGGRGIVREGNKASCGHKTTGSGNVFIG